MSFNITHDMAYDPLGLCTWMKMTRPSDMFNFSSIHTGTRYFTYTYKRTKNKTFDYSKNIDTIHLNFWRNIHKRKYVETLNIIAYGPNSQTAKKALNEFNECATAITKIIRGDYNNNESLESTSSTTRG